MERVRWMRVLPGALVAVTGLLGGCGGDRTPLMLASTTSTEDSGLFEVLIPAFVEAHPEVDVKVTAVGSGQALELGRRRDADVLLVHAPAAESAFVAAGHGTVRCDVMYNEFIIAGPPSDPAGIRGLTDAAEAFRRIAREDAPFISRGDDSGTHRKELSLWEASGVSPAGEWYKEVGQGMAEAYRMASESRGYVLSDRATYLSQRRGLDLLLLVEGDERLFNPYAVIPVSGAVHAEAARTFARWITGPGGQSVIRGFGADRYGEPLFVANASGCAVAGRDSGG